MGIAKTGDAITVCETADNIYSGTVIEALTDENGIYYWAVKEGNELFTVRFEDCVEDGSYEGRKKWIIDTQERIKAIENRNEDDYEANNDFCTCYYCGRESFVWEEVCVCEYPLL